MLDRYGVRVHGLFELDSHIDMGELTGMSTTFVCAWHRGVSEGIVHLVKVDGQVQRLCHECWKRQADPVEVEAFEGFINRQKEAGRVGA